LLNRGFLYLVLRCLRDWRTPRRESKSSLMACPLWISSAANTTCPDWSSSRAMPVVLLPGSSLSLKGWTAGCSTLVLSTIVNGYRFSTAAFPDESKMRARPGWTGQSGRRSVSTTKTYDMVSFLFAPCGASCFQGNGSLDEVIRRYFLLSTDYTYGLFNPEVLVLHAGCARAGRNFNAP
jgi:hypothetical protein